VQTQPAFENAAFTGEEITLQALKGRTLQLQLGKSVVLPIPIPMSASK
jgi:hypothetical protein